VVRQFNRGMEQYHAGRFDEAIDYFNRVVRADPQNAEAHFARGRTFQRLDLIESAQGAYLASYNLRPDARIAACLGYCSGKLKNHPSAIEQNDVAIRGGFETAEIFNNRGYSHLVLRHLKQAEEDLNKAKMLDSFLQAPHFNLALLAEVQAFEVP